MSSQPRSRASDRGSVQFDAATRQRIVALAKEIGSTRYEVRRYPAAIAQWKRYTDAAEAKQSVGVITPSEIAVAARVGRLLQVRLGGSRLLQKHVWEKAFADANFEGVEEAHVVAILEETWLRFYTHLRRLFPPS